MVILGSVSRIVRIVRSVISRLLQTYYSTSSYLHYQVSSPPPALAMAPASGTVPKGQAPNTLPYPLSVKKYSNSFSLYTNLSNSESSQAPRPLLLFLPWLGSKAKSHEKYIQLYFKLGFDVFVAESSVSHFLWPRTGLEHARQLLNLLMEQEDLSSRRLFVHAVSVGGYLFAQMLVCSSKEQRELLERVNGQVFDSLVIGSTERMATGVARMLSSPLLEPLLVRGMLLYFSLLKGQTADYYDRGIQTFLEKPVHSPVLFFYCLNDPMCDHVALEELMQRWEKQGIEVQGKKWQDSVHAGNLRKHTEEYTDTLNSFISSLLNNMPRSRL
ncbi:transmembrane protein 53-like isoform X3 [Aquarana catesbeiana]|uniref:transmembrane protein 53-like isoform X3 n=1 Tax=Aquarana catesbeiana TaxID=8400 RepID=UPI003CC9C73A